MANTIRLKNASTPNKVPTTSDLALGELALNTYDGKLYTKKDNGTATVIELGSGVKFTSATSAPSTPSYGDQWFDTNNAILYIYLNDGNTSQWVEIAGGSGSGVSSVDVTVPTGLSVSGGPITSSGTLAITLSSGYSIPTTSSQTNWDTAYTNRITTLTTTGSSGSATLISNTLNIPTYTLAGLGGIGLTDLSSTATGLTYTNTTGVFSLTAGYSIPTTGSQTNWDSAYSQRLQWDGGSTNLVAATGRTSLGATTVGSNLFTLANPSAITFPRINADNSVSTLDAATFRTAIGAGTSSTTGTVTSVGLSLPAIFSVTNSPVTSSGTLTGSLASQNANVVFAGPSTGVAASPTFRSLVAGDIPTLNQNTTGTASNVTGTVAIANGGTGQTTSTAAFNALAPSQTGNSGKYLKTDGTNTSWATVTAGLAFTAAATAPSSPSQGDQWFDTDTGYLYQYINDGNGSQWIQVGGNSLATGIPAGGTTNQFLIKSSNSDYSVTWSSTLNNPTILNYVETLYSPSANSAFTVDLTNGTIQKFTTNANTTITLPSSVSGKSFVIMVLYGGTHTITWAGGSTLKWAGGSAPSATSTLNKIDIFSFFQDGTNTYGASFGLNL